MQLNKELQKKISKLKTPFLIMDIDIIKINYLRLKKVFSDAVIFYAIKANSHSRILKLLRDLGSCFDIASRGELEKLLAIGIPADKISFGNTIKYEEDIEFAYKMGIRYFVADSELEIRKIAKYAPQSQVFIRLEMDSCDSDWPLSHKFGISKDEAIRLLILAKSLKLVPFGLSFHVGSQCYNEKRWSVALEKCLWVYKGLEKQGIRLDMLNLGGGFPVKHIKAIPSLRDISMEVYGFIERYFAEKPTIFLEPGRYMVGDAGIMVTSVINKREYGRESWLFVDAGVFHGLMETIEGFRYEILTDHDKSEHLEEFHLAGPTCDSVDVIYDSVILPKNISYKDRLYFINSGAYTVEYSTNFNGIEPPRIYFIDEL